MSSFFSNDYKLRAHIYWSGKLFIRIFNLSPGIESLIHEFKVLGAIKKLKNEIE